MQSGRRLPILRTRVVTAADLTATERADLASRMSAIVCQSYHGVDAEGIAESVGFRTPDARIALFYGRSGELAGFSSAAARRVSCDGVEHVIFDAGVFFDLRYEGGSAATRFGLLEALRVRAANPRVRLWFVSMTASPAPYCLAARTVSEIYPHPERTPPSDVVAVARAFVALKGLRPLEADPFVLHNGEGWRLGDGDRVRLAASLRDDPFSTYFAERNPRFLEGHTLLIVVPLHWKNVLFGLTSPVRALRRRRRAVTGPRAVVEPRDREAPQHSA